MAEIEEIRSLFQEYKCPKTMLVSVGNVHEWEESRKEACKELRQRLAPEKIERVKDIKLVSEISNLTKPELIFLAGELTKNEEVVACLGSEDAGDAGTVFARSKDLDLNCAEIIKDAISLVGGGVVVKRFCTRRWTCGRQAKGRTGLAKTKTKKILEK